jgi:protease-4
MRKKCIVYFFLFSFTFITALVAQEKADTNGGYRRFQLTAPAADDFGMNGFSNPANIGLLSKMNTRLFYGDHIIDNTESFGIASASGPLGFGFMHKSLKNGDYVRDYRLGMGFGDKDLAVGIGYDWQNSTMDIYDDKNYWRFGFIFRPHKMLSMAAFTRGNLRNEKDGYVQSEIAVRPFFSHALTLFGEVFKNFEGDEFDDDNWAIGAKTELFDGIRLAGKYDGNKSVSIGLEVSFGGGAISAAHVSDDGEALGRYISARIGYHESNLFTPMLAKEKKTLKIDLRGNVKYQKYQLFDDQSHSLLHLISDLNLAAKDYTIKTIAINLSGASINSENAWEIGEALKKAKLEGKEIIIYIDNAGMALYQIAAVADWVVMDPMGSIALPGYAMRRTYVKDMLDWMGVGVDELRFFRFKSAVESLSRTNMSEADSIQRQALVDNQYHLVKNHIETERSLSGVAYEKIVNEELVITSERALELGLVDTLERWVNMDDIVKNRTDKPASPVSRNAILAKKEEQLTWGERSQIAVVYALGVCAMDEGINARNLEKIFAQITKNPKIKAVVFRVDSPGGDAMASDVVAEAIKKCSKEKPVVISQGAVAASGGYWISMYGDKIIAAPNTITGSIGVIGAFLYDKGFSEHVGLDYDFVKKGKFADLGYGPQLPILGIEIPARPFTEMEREIVEKRIKGYYKKFVELVAAGRDTTTEAIEKVAQGRVWSGVDGKENGLVDELGGFDAAFNAARALANIPDEEPLGVVEYPKPGLININAFMPQFFGIETKNAHPYQKSIDYIKMLAKNSGKPLIIISPDFIEVEE